MKQIKLVLLILFLTVQTVSAQKTILWEVKHPSSGKTSYLLGSLHKVGNSFIDEKPIIKELLLKSDLAIFEAIEDASEKIVAVMKARNDDFTYRSVLDSSDIRFLESYTASWPITLSKLKPAELMIKLEQIYITEHCGSIKATDSFQHMDNYIMLIAKKHNVDILGLETYAEQFNAINNTKDGEYTWNKAKSAVHYWVENIREKKNKKRICAAVKGYMQMKFDYQFDVKCAENDPVLIKRNQKWMPIIIENIKSQNTFITVGLMHLFGDCGIITQLRKNGYLVTPVNIK